MFQGHAIHIECMLPFVKGSKVGALLFEYRLAPEHTFPAALEDALAAYHWLLSQDISPSSVVFVGDSAGGGLCLATLLALRDQSIQLPTAAAVLSPVTDFTCTGESYKTNLKKCLAPEGSTLAFAKHYAGNNDLSLPYISPLLESTGTSRLCLFMPEEMKLSAMIPYASPTRQKKLGLMFA